MDTECVMSFYEICEGEEKKEVYVWGILKKETVTCRTIKNGGFA